MAYNGSGVFTRLYSWVTDRNNGIKILASRMDAEMDGFATGLTTAITRDGQTTITQNIPFNSKLITGLGNAASDADALNRITGDGRFARYQAVTDKSADYTALADDIGKPLRFTAAATLTLTAAATLGNRWHMTVIADGGKVTVDPDGSETIDGVTTLVIPDGMTVTITCDGTRFFSTQFLSQLTELTGPLAGLRNKIINGLGTINQRGYTSGAATSTANQYTVDRWYVITSGQSLSWTESANVRTFTAPAGGVGQKIEGESLLSGTYTLSWTGTATATVGGVAVANGGTFSLTGGADATLVFSSGTFSKPQLEFGTVATPFEIRPYGLELMLCQRYYTLGTQSIVDGYGVSSNTLRATFEFATEMRAAPTISATASSSTNMGSLTTGTVTTGNFRANAVMTATAHGFLILSWTADAEL